MARKDKEGSPAKQPAPTGQQSCGNGSGTAANHGSSTKSKPIKCAQNHFTSMSEQLASLGLKLRAVLGDGNCLFRALGDQIDGHTKKHLEYRLQTVKYMRENREFFEPFIEDTTSFERHVALLGEAGTHAGNDAIVAFAGSFSAVVVVHQLNTPLYHIGLQRDKNRPPQMELHVAYHHGDHYDSIRKFDEPEGLEFPAFIHIPTIIKNPPPVAPVNLNNFDQMPFKLMQGPGIWEVEGSGRRLFGDDAADRALAVPESPSASNGAARSCERTRRRSGLEAAGARRASASSDDERIEHVRTHLHGMWNAASR